MIRAAKDIQIHFGWQCHVRENPDSEQLDSATLLKIGEANMPFREISYPELLVKWWKCNPNTVLSAFTPRNRVGANVVLPLTQSCYEMIKQGKLAEEEIGSQEIQNKSLYFLIGAGADRPLIKSEDQATKTKTVMACFLAMLAISVPPGEEGNVHAISFAACTESEQRLANSGFKHLLNTMKGSNFQLMEFVNAGINGIKIAQGIKMARLMLPRPYDSGTLNKGERMKV